TEMNDAIHTIDQLTSSSLLHTRTGGRQRGDRVSEEGGNVYWQIKRINTLGTDASNKMLLIIVRYSAVAFFEWTNNDRIFATFAALNPFESSAATSVSTSKSSAICSAVFPRLSRNIISISVTRDKSISQT